MIDDKKHTNRRKENGLKTKKEKKERKRNTHIKKQTISWIYSL
jgi:hypothetical protein